MASRIIANAGPGIGQALRAAIDNQAERGETSTDFGYGGGSPKRFAGQALLANGSGIGGAFASFLKDPEGTKYGQEFVAQWTSGPFRPVFDEGDVSTDTGVA